MAVGRTQGLAAGPGVRGSLRRDHLRHHPHRAPALVDHRLGRLRRPVPAHHAAGAGRAVPASSTSSSRWRTTHCATASPAWASAPEPACAASTSGSCRRSRRRPMPRLMGMGATRRIILADTLLQNYSDDEIEAVLAHELGHHVRRHILTGHPHAGRHHLLRLLADQPGAALRDRPRLVSGARPAALRLRQPAADHSRGDRAGLPADAGT